MPNLPTLSVNDVTTWNRLMDAFDSDPQAYKAWLKQALIQYMLDYEVAQQATVRRAQINSAMTATS